jgi:HNH endonuclease
MSNQKKSATLGMPHGTANQRLRKMILFDLLKRHNENVCVRCKRAIEEIDELSIEHIKPWEGISAGLFWDLSNIAFSHMECNMASRRIQTSQPLQRKTGPEGTAWCNMCKKFEPVENFHKAVNRWNGLQAWCKFNRRDRQDSVGDE